MKMLFAFVLGTLALSATLTEASQLFTNSGIQGSGIHSLDQRTGDPKRVMDLNFGARDLSSDAYSGSPFIYAVDFSNQLVKIRPSTQQIVSTVALVFPNANSAIRAIAVEPLTSRFVGASSSELFEINPNTGEASTIAAFASPLSVESMAFDRGGNLYGVGSNSFFSINSTDASVNVISNSTGVGGLQGLAVQPEDGTVFYAGGEGGYKLFTIDTTDGTLTTIGNTVPRPMGLAFAALPEPSSASLLVLVWVTCLLHRNQGNLR